MTAAGSSLSFRAAARNTRGSLIEESAANVHVVVLDADVRWTESVRRVLDHVGRPIVEARTAREARELIDRLRASLLVVGPTAAGELSWIAGARSQAKLLHVIVVTRAATADAAAAFAAGATAVITDSGGSGNLASALAIAAAGAPRPDPDRFGLSDREVEILEFVTRGASNAQIARSLWVSEQTVKFHLSRMYKKLGVGSRTEAAWVARSQGLVRESHAPSGGG